MMSRPYYQTPFQTLLCWLRGVDYQSIKRAYYVSTHRAILLDELSIDIFLKPSDYPIERISHLRSGLLPELYSCDGK